ncbi:stabilization of membrane putative [Desmophyllum pertusum]|uniref:Stabilization of membrane putative n=1 Tax=Desmophyllum pertusum TaxID=174260 RepID=A0A9W9YT58_9CNID|nr:stabilization of membrane putative [Desmophyllum pertusum]
MSTMLCALGKALEEVNHLPKVEPSTRIETDGIYTDIKANKCLELVDIEQENELKIYKATLEIGNEIEEKSLIRATREKLNQKYNISDEDWNKLERIMKQRYSLDSNTMWSFGNAFIFAGSVVTTVGYGNIVPRTANGRLFCIFYALVGIPLTCLALKTIGEKLRDVITSLIQNIKKHFDRSNTENVRKGIVFGINIFLWIITLLLLSILAHWRRGWTMLESFYFCFITFSTIGFGDFVAFDKTEANTVADYFIVFLGVVLGFAVTSTVLFSFSSVMEDKSQQTRLVEAFHEFKKRLTVSKRIAVAETLNTQEKEQCEELYEKETTTEEKK